jgi:xylulokinase
LIELVSNPALTGFTVGKILWVKNNEPETYNKIHKVLLPKDYIRFCLTGEYATEVSDASGTLLFDVKKRKWSEEMLKLLDIPLSWMPDCFESHQITGKVNKEAAKLTGLVEGTHVVGGGGDQAAQAVGGSSVEPGIISITIGTSGVVFAFSETPEVDPEGRIHTFCHAVEGKWHVMGVMLSAGGSLRWFRDNLGQDEVKIAYEKKVDPYEIILEGIDKIPAGS